MSCLERSSRRRTRSKARRRSETRVQKTHTQWSFLAFVVQPCRRPFSLQILVLRFLIRTCTDFLGFLPPGMHARSAGCASCAAFVDPTFFVLPRFLSTSARCGGRATYFYPAAADKLRRRKLRCSRSACCVGSSAPGSTAVHRSLLEILEESGLFFRDGDTICDANVHALIRASSLAVAPRALARQVIRFSTLSTIGLFVAGGRFVFCIARR